MLTMNNNRGKKYTAPILTSPSKSRPSGQHYFIFMLHKDELSHLCNIKPLIVHRTHGSQGISEKAYCLITEPVVSYVLIPVASN